MVFSGETQAGVLRYQIELILAGDEHINKREEHGKPTKYSVPKPTKDKIRDWYKGSVWVYDNNEADSSAQTMLNNMRTLYRRHNVKFFVIDNIMSMDWNSQSEWQMLQDQSNFIKECITFARRYDVAIAVVQHPTKKNERITKDDIRGTGNITNMAHGVILVHKLTAEDKKDYMKKMNEIYEAINWNIDIEVAKNRHNGKTPTCNIYYEESSRRLKGPKDSFEKKYGWVYANELF